MDSIPWTVEEICPNVHRITWRGSTLRSNGNQFRLLVTSDRHIDSPDSDRAMQRRHLEEARDGGWPVIDLGDFFDAMQSRHDKRRMPSDLRAEYMGRDDYVTALVEDASAFVRPFSDLFAVVGRGNHEAAIKTHNGVDLLSALVYRMKAENPACQAHVGGYGGWLIVQIEDGTPGKRKWADSVRIKYFHGSGGGGIMSKGTLANVRRAAIYPEADVVISGHIHENWSMVLGRERISRQGRVYIDEQLHVSVPSYKEEYKDGSGGWHVERGAPPKPVGAMWLTFTMQSEPRGNTNVYRIITDAVRAR